jgi:Zinc-binding loop region of homing endonuclease
METLGRDEIERAWKTIETHIVKITGPHGCVLTNYAQTQAAGYTQIRERTTGLKMSCHAIAGLYGTGCDGGDITGLQASHRCHNAACVNPTHIVFESARANKTRWCCADYGDQPNYTCPHVPKCLNCP